MSDFVKMKVSGLTIDPFTNMPIVILKDPQDKLALPIWIGLIEASSIATEMENIQLSRPMTHDLICTLLNHLNAQIDRVEIDDLKDQTFHANLHLVSQIDTKKIDCRPSDALALALRLGLPIFVHRYVIEKSRRIEMHQAIDEENLKKEQWAEILENLSPEDFGKYKM